MTRSWAQAAVVLVGVLLAIDNHRHVQGASTMERIASLDVKRATAL
jgi:hypothetical protein